MSPEKPNSLPQLKPVLFSVEETDKLPGENWGSFARRAGDSDSRQESEVPQVPGRSKSITDPNVTLGRAGLGLLESHRQLPGCETGRRLDDRAIAIHEDNPYDFEAETNADISISDSSDEEPVREEESNIESEQSGDELPQPGSQASGRVQSRHNLATAIIEKLCTVNTRLGTKINTLSYQVSERDKEIKKLNNQIKTFERRSAQSCVSQELIRKTVEGVQMDRRVRELLEDLAKLKAEKQALIKDKSDRDRAIACLVGGMFLENEQNLSTINAMLSEGSTSSDQTETERSQLDDVIAEKEYETDFLEKQIEDLETKLEREINRADEQRRQKVEHEKTIGQYRKQTEAILTLEAQRLAGVSQENECLKEQAQVREKLIYKIKKSKDRAQKKMKKKGGEIADLNKALSIASRRIESQEKLIEYFKNIEVEDNDVSQNFLKKIAARRQNKAGEHRLRAFDKKHLPVLRESEPTFPETVMPGSDFVTSAVDETEVSHSSLSRKQLGRTCKNKGKRPALNITPTEEDKFETSSESEEETSFRLTAPSRKRARISQGERVSLRLVMAQSAVEYARSQQREPGEHSGGQASHSVPVDQNTTAEDLHQQFLSRLHSEPVDQGIKERFEDCLKQSKGKKSIRADNCAESLNKRKTKVPLWQEIPDSLRSCWDTRLVKYGMYRMKLIKAKKLTASDLFLISANNPLHLLLLSDWLHQRASADTSFQRSPRLLNTSNVALPADNTTPFFNTRHSDKWTIEHCRFFLWRFDHRHKADNDRVLHNMLKIMNPSHPLYETMLLQYILLRLDKNPSSEAPLEWNTKLRESLTLLGVRLNEHLNSIPKPKRFGTGSWGYEAVANLLLDNNLIDEKTLPAADHRYPVKRLNKPAQED